MGADRVLLVAREGWVLRLLEEGLRDEGLVVASATRSDLALTRVQDMEPDCVVVDTELDDHDGYWVTVQVRGLSGPVAITPIALLAADDDAEARTRAFEAGADVLLTRPFRLDEILAQVRALVDFARRMRARRTSLMGSLHASTAGPPSSPEAAAFRAELAQMPVSGLLTLLELERKSGLVSARSNGRRVTLDLQSGYVTGATVDTVGVPVLEALALAVAFQEGTITFRAGFAVEPPADARPIRALLAELRAHDQAPVTPLAVDLALAAPVPASAPSGDVPSEPVAPLASDQSGAREVRPGLAADAGSEPEPIEDIGVLLGLDDIFDPPRLPAPPPTPSIVPPPKPLRSNGAAPRPAMTTTATPTHRAPPPDRAPDPPPRRAPDRAAPPAPPRRPALGDVPTASGEREPVPSVGPDTRQVDVPEVRADARPAPSDPAPLSGDGDADSARSTLRP